MKRFIMKSWAQMRINNIKKGELKEWHGLQAW